MLKKYLHALRVPEVVIMTGFFMIGGLFAVDNLAWSHMADFFLAFIMCFFLVLSIYEYNAYAGSEHDKQNKRLKKILFFKPSSFLYFYLLFFILSLSVSFFLNQKLWLFILLTQVLWFLYSRPENGFKTTPYVGSILHFLAQVLHFNMIWFIFKPLSFESLLISLFFSFLFSAGHIHHELIDYDSDVAQNLHTGASKMGFRMASHISFFLFILAHFYLSALFALGIIESSVFIIFISGFCFQLLSLLIIKPYNRKNSYNMLRYRSTYRIIVFTECLLLVVSKLTSSF